MIVTTRRRACISTPSTRSRRWCARPRSSAAWSGSSRWSCTEHPRAPMRSCRSSARAIAPTSRRCATRRRLSMDEHSFLVDAAIYLAAAVVFVPLASRLRLGAVLGYLFAGCLIGPFGLGLVSDIESILHFAEFGVVLMLFVIGLELDPSRLWAMRARVFGGGSLQMLVCGSLLAAGGLAIGLPWQAAVIAGFALALSSTAIAVQTMTERGVLNSTLGQTAFGVLLFQDIAAIPLVGIVPLLSTGPTAPGGSLWLGSAKVAAAIVGVVLIGRYATRPALRAIARIDLRDIFTAFALLLVIAIALLMDLVGVSMALGAFLAGVLLVSSEYRHALET